MAYCHSSGACSCRANQYACTLRQEIIPEKGALILFLLTRKQALRGNTLFILVARLCAIRGLRIETRVRSPARWPTAKGLDPGWARSRISAGAVFATTLRRKRRIARYLGSVVFGASISVWRGVEKVILQIAF